MGPKRSSKEGNKGPTPSPTPRRKSHKGPLARIFKRATNIGSNPGSSKKREGKITRLPGRALETVVSHQNVLELQRKHSFPEIDGKETDQDLLDRYNLFFKKHKQDEEAGESLSSDGDPEIVERSREFRQVVMRRLLIASSLLLWLLSATFFTFVFLIYNIWPRHFAVDTFAFDVLEVKLEETNIRWFILIWTTAPPFLVGAWGLLSATCGQDRCLWRFMLTAPWLIIFPLGTFFVCVKFMGTLSQQNIANQMFKSIGDYFGDDDAGDALNGTDAAKRIPWDRVQVFLHCCGIEGPKDWDAAIPVDHLDRVPASCCENEFHHRERDPVKVKSCQTSREHEHSFKLGCKGEAYQFYTHWGGIVTMCSFSTCLCIVFAVLFAHRFFVLERKLRLQQYRYPCFEYMCDFLYLRRVRRAFKRFKEKRQLKKILKGRRKLVQGKDLSDIAKVRAAAKKRGYLDDKRLSVTPQEERAPDKVKKFSKDEEEMEIEEVAEAKESTYEYMTLEEIDKLIKKKEEEEQEQDQEGGHHRHHSSGSGSGKRGKGGKKKIHKRLSMKELRILKKKSEKKKEAKNDDENEETEEEQEQDKEQEEKE